MREVSASLFLLFFFLLTLANGTMLSCMLIYSCLRVAHFPWEILCKNFPNLRRRCVPSERIHISYETGGVGCVNSTGLGPR